MGFGLVTRAAGAMRTAGVYDSRPAPAAAPNNMQRQLPRCSPPGGRFVPPRLAAVAALVVVFEMTIKMPHQHGKRIGNPGIIDTTKACPHN